MRELPDFSDKKAVEAWFETQPPEVAIAIAARASLRVLPKAMANFAPNAIADEVLRTRLAVFRAVLVTAVAAMYPADQLQQAKRLQDAARAAARSIRAALPLDFAVHVITRAADAVNYTVCASIAAVHSAAHSTNRSATLAANAADAARACLDLPTVFDAALWPDELEVPKFAQIWADFRDAYEDDPVWGFWVKWYAAMWHGAPLDWDLQTQIALIDDTIWEQGPEAVANKIREIEDAYWEERLPQAEQLTQNPETGKFSAKPLPFDGQQAVVNWLNQIEFALSLAVDSNTSDFNRMSTAFKYLDHTLTTCRDDPNAIEQNVGIARGMIDTNLADKNFTDDDALRALSTILEQVQLQMRADHPDVRKAWEKRIAQKIREADRQSKLEAAKAIRAEQERTEGRMKTEMGLDAETVETAKDPEVQAVAMRRAGGRSAKMNMIDRASATVKNFDASAGYKAGRIGTTGYSIVEKLIYFFGS